GFCHKSGVHEDTGPQIDSGSHTAHLAYGFTTMNTPVNPIKCTACHTANTIPPKVGVLAFNCSGCHTTHNPDLIFPLFQAMHIDGEVTINLHLAFGSGNYNGTPAPGDGYGSCSDLYCHSDGTSLASTVVPANTAPAWGTSGSLACDSCHENGPSYANGAPKANSHVVHLAQSLTCDQCHYTTTNDGISISSRDTHVNLAYDVDPGAGVSFTYTFNAGVGACSNITCHGATDASWGTTACLGCHSVVQGGRAAVGGQFSSNSHHIQGGQVTDAHCYECHWEANSDGTIASAYHGGTNASGAPVDLVIYGAGSRPIVYAEGTTAVRYTADGSRSEIAQVNDHCLGCHSDQNNNTYPFGDGKTPKQYAWDGTSVAARYSQFDPVADRTPWGKYTGPNITPKATQTKAYSAHGNAVSNQGGWELIAQPDPAPAELLWTNTRGGSVNVACYDCHNSHGSSVTGTTTSYASATGSGGILKDTQASVGGYSVTYQPVAGGSADEKNLYNPGASLCFDCHMKADGSGSQPWGYNTTFGATAKINGYSDPPYFASTGAGNHQRYPYKNQLNNKGGHFGASSSLGSTPGMSIGGLCTPCHDPHGVSPSLGANQQYSVPLLKGSWLTSPYKEDVAPASTSMQRAAPWTVPYDVHINIDQNTFGTHFNQLVSGIAQADSQFAGLCLTCHPKENLTDGVTHAWKSKDRIHESVKGWEYPLGSATKHKFSCSKCHAPHSTGQPRLMVTNCMDWTHKGRTANSTGATASGTYEMCGWGDGRIPGNYNYDACDSWGQGSYTAACHEAQNAHAVGDTDQSWNMLTPWGSVPTLTISAPSALTSSSSNIVKATITWSSNLASSSIVNYGLTSTYDQTITLPGPVTAHSVLLSNLSNHKSYHYQVSSNAYLGQQATSGDRTFTTNIPPSIPSLKLEPTKGCPGGCNVPLEWNASTDPDGNVVEYFLQLDDNSGFTSPDISVGWTTATTATVGPLASDGTWYWRVQARDSVYNTAVSNWSNASSFKTQAAYPAPNVPAHRLPGNNSSLVCDCNNGCSPTFYWYASSGADPDNGPVDYLIEVDTVSSFDSPDKKTSVWITGASSVVSAAVGPLETAKTWYWHVKARYTSPVEQQSIWSAAWSLNTLYPPPSMPTGLSSLAYNVCVLGDCSMPLNWNASTACATGGEVEYNVQVSDNSGFVDPIIVSPGWIDTISWLADPLEVAKTWFWRVRARDAVYNTAVSNFTNGPSFKTTTAEPPAKPVIIPHGNYNSACLATDISVQWYEVSSPDGDPVDYYIYTSLGDSGWQLAENLPAGSVAGTKQWTFNGTGTGITWKVMARDRNHPDATSAWSNVNSFDDIGCWGSSCPLVFAWTGTTYDYITDLAGPIIGLPARGTKKPVNLYQPAVAMLDDLVPDGDGQYRVKMRESLPEISFIDSVSLLVADYPQGYELYTSGAETTYNYRYVEPLHFYTAKDPVLPISAVGSDGRDVLASVLAVDNIPASMDPFDPGYYYLLDFGTIQQPQYAKLLLDSWSIFGVRSLTASGIVQPYIELVDADGNWVKVRSFGTPSGDLKTMVVDLSNLFLSDDHRIRIYMGIRPSSRWVIDRVRLDQSAPVAVAVQELQAISAELQFGGDAIETMSTLDSRIIASNDSLPVNSTIPSYGNFTRYGDVFPLLTSSDDKFVIMREGDEVELLFPALSQPQLGDSRSFIINSDLYYKSLEVINTVEPLPFHGMSDFPYPETESYPMDADHLQYLEEYNTRIYLP
ncbi:MAG: CxxxxCH/CxxCH domain-containing protein, partial [Desulfobulbaceae bacterium]|nr:CxxxxCH/CxxCH domain-containing protein [Desulfobulbaceae bacterium]